MKFFIIFLQFSFLLSNAASAEPFATTVYGRTADLQSLQKLVNITDLHKIIQIMETTNLKIYKIPVSTDGKQTQSFDFLDSAPVKNFPELAYKVSDVDSGSALFVSQNEIPHFPKNIILIASDANPMTVFHEFTHHLFEIQNHKDTQDITNYQNAYENMLRRFNFKTSKIMLNYSLLISKQWRDEIKDLCEEYSNSIEQGQGTLAAEEVAVETALLNLLVDSKSPHLNLKRAQQGINGYAQGLIIRSDDLARNILALNDLIVTEGIDQDPHAQETERIEWAKRRVKIEKVIFAYIDGPLEKMKKQVLSAQETLRHLQESKKHQH